MAANPGPCGWCKDKWGVSLQITPRVLTEALTAGGDEAKHAFDAMVCMKKIDVAAIKAARQRGWLIEAPALPSNFRLAGSLTWQPRYRFLCASAERQVRRLGRTCCRVGAIAPMKVQAIGVESRHAQCADECPLLEGKRTWTNRCLANSIYECTA